MRRALLVLFVAVACFAAAPARADEAAPTQAWSRTSAVPTFLAQADRLYVAADLGKESARAYIATADGPGALVVREAADGSTLPDTATIVACALSSPIAHDGEIDAKVAPAVDCAAPVPAVRATDGTWTIPLESFAHAPGVALVARPSGTATYRVALDSTKTAVVPVASTTPAPAATATATPVTDSTPPLVTPALPASSAPTPTTSAAVTPIAARAAAESPGPGGSTIDAATPSAFVVLALVVAGAVALSLRVGRTHRDPSAPVRGIPARSFGWLVAAVVLCLFPALLDETTVYKIGLVLIVLVAAIGLHLLVNWAGELSLAHATLVGLPAFVVAKISSEHGISPILLLPIGMLVGLLAGAVVGLPAIRARGLQVALVTLAGGVAIDRFFFTKEWLVGSVSSPPVATPSFGPFTFDSSQALYPVLAVIVVLTIAVAWAIYRSKLGRAFLWIKAQPDAAAAFGIPVARYRALAYALAGAFAGLAGGLTTVWVQRLTPEAFPLSRSFTFLIIVALAGRGFVGGVAVAAAAVEGGTLFLAGGGAFITYAAPIGLLFTLTKHPTGLNGLGHQLAARLRVSLPGRHPMTTNRAGVRPLLAFGMTAVAVGFASIVLAWYHSGNTSQVWIQNQEMILGGLGGLGLVVVGVGLVIYDRLLAVRAAEAERWERMFDALAQQQQQRPRRPLRAKVDA